MTNTNSEKKIELYKDDNLSFVLTVGSNFNEDSTLHSMYILTEYEFSDGFNRPRQFKLDEKGKAYKLDKCPSHHWLMPQYQRTLETYQNEFTLYHRINDESVTFSNSKNIPYNDEQKLVSNQFLYGIKRKFTDEIKYKRYFKNNFNFNDVIAEIIKLTKENIHIFKKYDTKLKEVQAYENKQAEDKEKRILKGMNQLKQTNKLIDMLENIQTLNMGSK